MSRLKVEINWGKVDELLESGCTVVEIAGYFSCDRSTLYNRFEDDFKSSFSTHIAEKKQKGESILRDHQYKKALGLTDKGDNTLLIWLGKCRLKQRETDLQETSPNQESLARDDVNFKLQAENALLKQKLAENADKR